MNNKKISNEVAIGIVLLVVVLISGAFYSQSKKEQSVVISEIKQPQIQNQQVSTPQDNIQTNIYADATYDFEITYPSGWSITKPSSAKQDKQNLIFVFSTNGQLSDGTKGTLLFGKYDIYNDSLTDSVDGNVNILNSKVNIIGSKSSYKEVKIEGGRAFINQTQSTIASNEREIFIVGKNVIFNGNVSINYNDTMDEKKIAEFDDILSHFKFLQ